MWYKFSIKTEQPSLFFEPWHEGNVIKNEQNQPKVLYHGTLTPGFDEFDVQKGSPDSYFGRAIYTTDDPNDANKNYSNENSPDWNSKISRLQDLDEIDRIKAKEKLGIDNPRPSTIPLYGKMKNPVILDTTSPRYEMYQYNEELDDFTPGQGEEIINALRDTLYDYGYDADHAINMIIDKLGENFNQYDLNQQIRGNIFLDDTQMGNFMTDFYKRLGHDGIIMPAHEFWPGLAQKPTNHYIFFDSKQVKSPFNKLYNPESNSLTAKNNGWYKISQQTQSENLNIPLPDYVNNILSDIMKAGGRAVIVGGAVRDALLGKSPKDIDFEVYRVSYEDLTNILQKYGKADLVGQSFGVIKFVGPDGLDFDFSLPRTDSKAGVGHKDFNVQVSSDLTPEQAAARRDFTFNAISYDPLTGEIIDPYNGREDLKNKIMRHTSEAFSEDPLRVLRGMQFASRYGFTIAPESAQLAQSIKDQYQHLPKERVEGEFKKLVQKGVAPGAALQYLYDTGWSENFPHIHNLKGVPQDPEWHPEGWELTAIPFATFKTGITQAKPINLLTRQFVLDSFENPATIESNNITANTKFFVQKKNGINNLFTTNAASLINRSVTVAQNKNKIIGVMFKIPTSSVLAMMGSSTNDNQIIQGMIHPIAIKVGNILAEKNETNSISSTAIDPKFSIINNDIIFYFYLSSMGEVDTQNNNIHECYLVKPGGVDIHTAHVMNAAAEIADRQNLSPEDKEVLIYAALAHDFAKPATTKTIFKKGQHRITSYGHEEAGGPMARHFLESIGVNKKVIDKVVPLVENHLNHIHFANSNKQDSFVKKLAERLHPATIQELERLVEADQSGRPPLPKILPEEQKKLSELARKYNTYTGKHPDFLRGKDILEYTNGQGGPIVGQILSEHRNKILNHELTSREQALDWLAEKMKKNSMLINGGDIAGLGIKGPQIKQILDQSWQAQKSGKFNDKSGAMQWLNDKQRNN